MDTRETGKQGSLDKITFTWYIFKAVKERVSASTQNQALCAIMFLYRHVLNKDIGLLEGLIRAKKPKRPPPCTRNHPLVGRQRCGSQSDHDLHPCAEQGWARREEPN